MATFRCVDCGVYCDGVVQYYCVRCAGARFEQFDEHEAGDGADMDVDGGLITSEVATGMDVVGTHFETKTHVPRHGIDNDESGTTVGVTQQDSDRRVAEKRSKALVKIRIIKGVRHKIQEE